MKFNSLFVDESRSTRRPIIEGVDYGFVVFKVTSPNTHYVYYGYGQENSYDHHFERFLANQQSDRGEAQFIRAAGGHHKFLRFHELDITHDEYDAFLLRNDYRSRDPNSITGPSALPGTMWARVKEQNPEKIKAWEAAKQKAPKQTGSNPVKHNINKATAKEAMDKTKFGNQAVYDTRRLKSLVGTNSTLRQDVIRDLDQMLYSEFVKKYFPHDKI